MSHRLGIPIRLNRCKMKNLFLAILLVIAMAPLSLFVYNIFTGSDPVEVEPPIEIKQDLSGVLVEFESAKPKKLEPGTEFLVNSCRIIDGYRFNLKLEGDNEISAQLSTATKEVATSVVTELIRGSVSPSVVLLRKVGEDWIIRFYLTKDEKRTDLLVCLREQGLLLE